MSEVQIQGQPLNPSVCQFTVDRAVHDGKAHCTSARQAKGSALFERLFTIEGVREVLVAGNQITVSKSSAEDWPVLGKQIGAAIREALQSGETLISEKLSEKKTFDHPKAAEVQKLLDDEINPAIASHGGHVELVKLEEDVAYVEFSGGCQGCAASSATLKEGIEKTILEKIPSIREVRDSTDHTSGENPYYS